VDDSALIEALKAGAIAGAGLDVFTAEPLPAESEYRKLGNVLLTSHIASSTYESFWNMYKAAVDIADNYFKTGDDPRMLV
jgi:D-3-phosphoglycerate dehydrogenase